MTTMPQESRNDPHPADFTYPPGFKPLRRSPARALAILGIAVAAILLLTDAYRRYTQLQQEKDALEMTKRRHHYHY